MNVRYPKGIYLEGEGSLEFSVLLVLALLGIGNGGIGR